MTGATVHFTDAADGVHLAWASQGSGPALVLSRGWITHLEHSMAMPAFRRYVDVLATAFRVVRFDGRGNGMSDWDIPRPVTPDDLVGDLAAVIDASGAAPCVLWGSSWGGPAAIAFAAEHPDEVTHLVLDGTFADGDRLATAERRAAFLSLFDVADAAPDAVFAALSHLTRPDADDATANLAARGRGTIRPDIARELYTLLYEIDVRDRLPSVDAPTLVLHRRRSRAVPFDCGRRLAAGIPGAQLVALEGSAHNVWDERPEESLAAVGAFLGVALVDEPAGAPPAAPTTAILFSDIVASTADQSRLGDGLAYERVRTHDTELRAAASRFGGREVKHTGDGMMVAFPGATAAVSAAVAFQGRLAERRGAEPERVPWVAVGINAGEPIADDSGDLHGLAVTIAARVCAAAARGQVLVTAVVRDLTTGSRLRFRSVGPHVLKGLDEPVELYEALPLDA